MDNIIKENIEEMQLRDTAKKWGIPDDIADKMTVSQLRKAFAYNHAY